MEQQLSLGWRTECTGVICEVPRRGLSREASLIPNPIDIAAGTNSHQPTPCGISPATLNDVCGKEQQSCSKTTQSLTSVTSKDGRDGQTPIPEDQGRQRVEMQILQPGDQTTLQAEIAKNAHNRYLHQLATKLVMGRIQFRSMLLCADSHRPQIANDCAL